MATFQEHRCLSEHILQMSDALAMDKSQGSSEGANVVGIERGCALVKSYYGHALDRGCMCAGGTEATALPGSHN